MPKALQAKHIPDDEVMAVVNAAFAQQGYAVRWIVAEAMPHIPHKVLNARLRSLDKRGLISGYCDCGCSSPFFPPEVVR